MIDAIYRMVYRVAYQGARVYWLLFKPDNHGALVAMWCHGKVLLVKNSYVSYYSLPGGNVRASENAREAAVRELKEEIGLSVEASQLTVALDHTHEWQGRSDHVVIFELDLKDEPKVQVDNREVVSAEWLRPEQALALSLFPPLKRVIEDHLRGAANGAVGNGQDN